MPLDYHQNHYLHLLAQENYYYMSLVTVTKLSVIECLLRMFPCLSPFSSLVTMYFEYSETQLITIVKVLICNAPLTLLLWLAANLSSTKFSSISTILRQKIMYSEQPRDMLDSGRILVVPGAEYMLAVTVT